MKQTSSMPWLVRNIIVFGVASLLSDMSYELAVAALPEFLSQIANSHATAAILGLITGLADAVSYFSRFLFGWFSDRLRVRKPFVVLGYLIAGGSVSFLALVTSKMQVLFTMLFSRLGKGLRNPARDALLADSVDSEYYGRAFGFHRSMDTLGALIGPLILFVFAPFFSLRFIFLLAGLPALIAAFIVFNYAQEIKPEEESFADKNGHSFLETIWAFPTAFLWFSAIVFLFNCAFFHPALLIFYLQKTQGFFGSDAVRAGALAYAFFNCVRSLAEYFVGFLSDRRGSLTVLAWCGYFLFGVLSFLLYAVSPTLLFFIPVFFIGGMTKGIIDTLERVVAAELVSSRFRATAFGVLFGGKGCGMAIAGIVVGNLWSAFDPRVAWIYVFSVSSLATLALFMLSRYTLIHGKSEDSHKRGLV